MFPILITEDLSDAYWPASNNGVAWRKGDIDNLFTGIKAISEINASSMLPAQQKGTISIWSKITANPSGFLRLNLCSEIWFNKCKQTLIDAESKVDITGDCLVHGDMRSDNICFKGHQSMFVDWSHASRGSKNYDLSMLLPTLYLEAGPLPFEIMPDGGREASLACARHIKRIADKQMPDWLRKIFLKLIAIELEWAAQCLQLSKPDGVTWQSL
ncbi:MAG: phosphotransferase [Pedobacter sp.]|uniref:phosphotransferase n=1 Tax=Pedobacter sp. TaxID=1411316 RepID=UPI0033976F0F